MGALAVLDVLERDGTVRHSVAVHAWPLRLGRALDNDLVLADPHTAAHHLEIVCDDEGHVLVAAGESVNGVQLNGRPLAAGQRAAVGDAPALLVAGRTQLRLRLARHALAPELPLRAAPVLGTSLRMLVLLALAVLLVLAAGVYLDTDPAGLVRALGAMVLYASAVSLGWCVAWMLLSKVFTHQAHFGWHVRVFLIAMLAWTLVMNACGLLAFAFSWPWVSDFSFVLGFLILGAMLYFHLQAVEPQHPRRSAAIALSSVLVGVGATLWLNWQGSDRLGSELYMSHLFPPALRVAQPVPPAQFMQGLAALQPVLDEKAAQHAED